MSSKKELVVIGDSFCVDLISAYNYMLKSGTTTYQVYYTGSIRDVEIKYQEPFPIWSEIIAKELNLKLVNLSKAGTGNDYMLGKALDYITKNKKKIEKVIIAWSGWYRVDIEVDYSDHETALLLSHLYPKDLTDNYQSVKNFNEVLPAEEILYNKYPYPNKISSINKFFRNVYLMQTVCETFNIDYRMIQSVPIGSTINFKIVIDEENYVPLAKQILDHDYFDLINDEKFIGWPIQENLGGFSMSSVMAESSPIYYLNKYDIHPNKKGMELISKMILDTL